PLCIRGPRLRALRALGADRRRPWLRQRRLGAGRGDMRGTRGVSCGDPAQGDGGRPMKPAGAPGALPWQALRRGHAAATIAEALPAPVAHRHSTPRRPAMRRVLPVLLILAAIGSVAPAFAQSVKITPLGSHDGEFCPLDRALVFEDPYGTRILYDAGRTVRGPEDPRLGRIDAVLLTHVHSDHLGDAIQPAANAGECAKPDFSVKVTPNSNTVNIVVGKKASLIVGSEMPSFFARKVKEAGG